ncbi:hypothetical protein PFISCL1PPCAC_27420, partial [Pristionchus fissidentatus]
AAQYPNPFHSPHVDPVGSIIGLRVLYIDGNMCYVPVEPHVNFMINQQFGRKTSNPPIDEYSEQSRINGRSIIQELQTRQSHPDQRNSEEFDRGESGHYDGRRTGMNQDGGKASNSSSGVSSLSGEGEMDDPPWARPHPQPANGKRGTAAWRNESSVPRKSSMNRQPPGGFSSDLFGTGLSSASTQQSYQSHQSRRSQPHVYEPPPPQETRKMSARNNYPQPESVYDPWGRGGCGAPLKDNQGNVVADRRRMVGGTWNRSVDTTNQIDKDRTSNYVMHSRAAFPSLERPSIDWTTNNNHLPYFYAPTPTINNYSDYQDEFSNRRSMAHATSMPSLASKQMSNLSPADQHRAELELQIRDNRRRKEEERQKEIEMEKREIQRWEERNARIREEEEEAKRKAKEKAIALERRKAVIAEREARFEQQQQPRGRRTPPPQIERRDPDENEGEPKLEWWEKKPTWQERMEREPSAIIPTLRKGARTPSAPSRVPSVAGDRGDSRQSYRASDSVREHSARRTSLVHTPVQQRRAPPKKAEAFTITG